MSNFKIPWLSLTLTTLPNVGGFIGAIYVRENVKGWYETLDRPSWKPPNYMFAPVWTTLYTGMGYASYLVYRDGFNGTAKIPLLLYSSQLILNWAWTPLFFHLHKLKWSLYEICALWTNVALCAIAFYRVNKVAGCLMVPYLGWLSLATGLTYYIYTNNKEISIKEE